MTDTPTLTPAIEEEDKEIEAVEKTVRITPKMTRWIQLFLDQNNTLTFGNQTQSAMIAYGLNPDTQYWSAATIGKENYKKLQTAGSMYLEKRGVSFGKMLDIAVVNMHKVKGTAWWDRVAALIGLKDMIAANSLTVNMNQTTVNNTQYNLQSGEVKDWNKRFKSFVEAEENTSGK